MTNRAFPVARLAAFVLLTVTLCAAVLHGASLEAASRFLLAATAWLTAAR